MGDEEMKVASLFTGVGGFDLGLERVGMGVVLQVEQDKWCNEVLANRWPNVETVGDVRDVGDVDADMIVGGFPCQDISVAGKRKGLEGDRSGLWWEFYRIIAGNRPEWVIIENVPNLLRTNRGRDMGAIVGTLSDLGYGVGWRVLDSQFFGVPQRRKRVFIVGHLGDRDGGRVLFDDTGGAGDRETGAETGETRQDPGTVVARADGNSTQTHVAVQDVANTLQARDGKGVPGYRDFHGGRANLVPVALHLTQTPVHGEVSPTLSAEGRIGVGYPVSVHENQRAEITTNDTIGSLTTGGGKPGQGYPAVAEPPSWRVRRLTPRECERLQGFPDDWTRWTSEGREIAKTHRYRMMGNAVTVPVIEWIGGRILAHMADMADMADDPSPSSP